MILGESGGRSRDEGLYLIRGSNTSKLMLASNQQPSIVEAETRKHNTAHIMRTPMVFSWE